VRVHFQERPWDLYLLIGYTIVAPIIIVELGLIRTAGILPLLFPPGYFLVATLHPGREAIDWAERLALAMGLGVVVVGVIYLLLQLTTISVDMSSFTSVVAFFSLFVAGIALWRRIRIRPEDRLSATINLRLGFWKESSTLDKIATIVLLSGILLGGLLIGYLTTNPQRVDQFTEFYVLGPGGKAADYPTELNVSQPGTILVGITNHETAKVNYTIRFDLVGVKLVYNSTSQANETIEQNRTTWSWSNATLGDGQKWIQPYTFRIASVGLWKVQLLLYKDGDLLSIYSEVHILVQVT